MKRRLVLVQMSLLDLEVREVRILQEFAASVEGTGLRFFRWLHAVTGRELARRERQRIAQPAELLPAINPASYDVAEVLFTLSIGLAAVETFGVQSMIKPARFVREAMSALADGSVARLKDSEAAGELIRLRAYGSK